MTCIAFKEHLVVDANIDVTIEDAFRYLSEYAGIHDFDFDDELADSFATLDSGVWGDASTADATWVISDGKLSGTGGGSAQWYWFLADEDVPDTFVMEVTKYSARGAVAFLAVDLDDVYYAAWSSSTCSIEHYTAANGTEILCSLPKTDYTGEADITLSVQKDDDYFYVSMWADGEFVVNACIDSSPTGRKVGLGVYESDTSEYDDLRIPELTSSLAILTMDVGETPLGALQRALGRRHINYFVRWNGQMRAWRPKAQDSTATISASRVYDHNEQRDRRGLVSHWRQIGAWDVADAYDETLMASIGHRFHKDDNPDLMSESECETEADQNLVRAKEYAHTLDTDTPTMIFTEPEDRVTIRDNEWILTSYGFQVQAGALPMSGSWREYTYG